MQSMEQPLDSSQVEWYVSFRGHNCHLKYTFKCLLNLKQMWKEKHSKFIFTFFSEKCTRNMECSSLLPES